MPPRYSEEEARSAIAASRSWAEALRNLAMCPTGGAHKILRKYAEIWGIPTDHFDPYARRKGRRRGRIPLEEILVEGSTFSRNHLKERLYDAGLLLPRCELCGQDERWHGRMMGMILDHINGVSDDNRLENLRIVCPNCASTLETHCGRRGRQAPAVRSCERCGESFRARYQQQRFCSRRCGVRASPSRGPRPDRRLVLRPPYAQLQREVSALGFSAVGRRYGVSDNAIRKWLRQYEEEARADQAA